MQLDLSNAELPMRLVGRVGKIVHSAPHDRLWRLLHHKRWYYTSLTTDDFLFAGSIVDLGYLSKGFVYLADRQTRNMRLHREVLWPYARVTSDRASLHSPKLWLQLRRHDGMTSFAARGHGLRVQIGLQERSPPFATATLLSGGASHVTEKTLSMDAAGEIDGMTVRGTGAIDYTDGFVSRRTLWKWANFSAPGVALNLTQGFVGSAECFAVVAHKHVPLGAAQITMPTDPMQPWQVTTSCGRVALTFTPFALHADSTDLGLVHAKFRQPIGTFAGTVAGVTVERAIGVCEDQDVLW